MAGQRRTRPPPSPLWRARSRKRLSQIPSPARLLIIGAVSTLAHPTPQLDRDGLEVRHATDLPFEVRAEGDDAEIQFEGYAAPFNRRSQLMFGEFVEVIAPGAFRDAIARDDVRFVVNHDPNLVLARHRNVADDTMELREDTFGLRVSARMAPTSYARDLATVIRRGDVSGMSFRFRALDERWDIIRGGELDGVVERTLLAVKLRDVSVVTYPAYLDTSASVRSAGLAGLASALGLDELDDERRQAALELIASGGDAAEILAGIRALTHPPAPTPHRDRVARRMSALATAHRLTVTPGGQP